jgi:predicted RNA binding protein YcfA (HicA-like mRNA interferase family)
MAQLPILSGRKIVRALQKIGYFLTRQRGSHMRLSHKSRRPVTVPDYRTVSKGLLRKILRDAELPPDDFLGLLD